MLTLINVRCSSTFTQGILKPRRVAFKGVLRLRTTICYPALYGDVKIDQIFSFVIEQPDVHELPTYFSGKIFLGGLPRNCTEETLTQYFTKFGEIIETTVVRDHETGNPRGFGFIKFKDPDSVQTALAAGQHTIDGKQVIYSKIFISFHFN